jgi:hypothetical protein
MAATLSREWPGTLGHSEHGTTKKRIGLDKLFSGNTVLACASNADPRLELRT